jgi:Lon protease-like protein
MAGLPFSRSISELPRTLPVFPLPGALLLPRGTLPLNIFEPRYVAMFDHALKTDRLIGMIQPCEDAPDVGAAATYDIGCAGRVTQFQETDDGRYVLTLTGIARFHVAREMPQSDSGYRLVEPDFAEFADDLGGTHGTGLIDRDGLLRHLREFFSHRGIDANWDAIEQADDESLVTALAMVCPFEPSEKQALLEARDLMTRADTLLALLQMGGESPGSLSTQ